MRETLTGGDMLATQTPDMPPETKDVKQRIKEKLALSLKALQKRHVASDTVVTSEDGEANLLCCALEAIFIHGIKSKYVRSDAGGRGRKGGRGPLPQPFFWSLLKTVTHRDVIAELEKLSFVNTDVGRCRAWLRLALNHSLLECYLASLFREGSKLQSYYQPTALLLNPEEREVLISYLQGLASLTFSLSYKSSVLNEWTTTPLALAGLCPISQAEELDLRLGGRESKGEESWDTASQSSCSSDPADVQRASPGELGGKGTNMLLGSGTVLNSSNLSLDTTGSSQLSSSISSDSLLQGQDPRSPTGEPWSSCDLDLSPNVNNNTKRPLKDVLGDFRESGHSSQDSTHEGSIVSSTGPDPFSETATSSGSDSEPSGPPMPSPDAQPSSAIPPEVEPPSQPTPPQVLQLLREAGSGFEPEPEFHTEPTVREAVENPLTNVQDAKLPQEDREVERSAENTSENSVKAVPSRSNSVLSRQLSSENSHSWISEEDIYMPHLEEVSDLDEVPACVNGLSSATPEPNVSQSPPSVVHRRQIGITNPFRGLLKLGHLERRSAVGMWRDHYCELSPFEFRLYLNAEERTCCDNCSLLRCEDAGLASPEGRFELAFPGKRLYLRAANRGEAEDWVDRIVEAVNKCRPAHRPDDKWEVLKPSDENGLEEPSPPFPSSSPSSPERGALSVDPGSDGGQQAPLPPAQELDWTRAADLESDAIKESVLYFATDPEAQTWVPLVFSLSLEALKGYQVQDGRKSLRLNHPIEGIRDVVPDAALGGPAFFKLLTFRDTLRLRAESPEEARSWRMLIRGALDSYLDCSEDGVSDGPAVVSLQMGGNTQRLVQHGLKADGVLLAHLYTVASEKGLDSQNFKCAGCPRKIGLSMGRARLCEFSGQYYCESCHYGDTTILPARVVHNWDLTPREVSRKALKLLDQIEHEPLLNLEQLNPDLLEHAEPMAQVHRTRQQLRLLGDYLLTCRSGACKKFQARTEQRTYLLESSHLYCVMDLRQIADGQYTTYLNTLVQFASNHVHHCDLCTQRGFICQICHADDIIFPFQFDSTTRCEDCKSVFHLTCKERSPPCPRCLRLRKYLERDLQD